MILAEEVFDAIDSINHDMLLECSDSDYPELANPDLPYVMTLKMLTNGEVHSVQFMGCCIWQSDVDEREKVDGHLMDLEDHLRNRIDDILLSIYELGYIERLWAEEQELLNTDGEQDPDDEEVEPQESDVEADKTTETSQVS